MDGHQGKEAIWLPTTSLIHFFFPVVACLPGTLNSPLLHQHEFPSMAGGYIATRIYSFTKLLTMPGKTRISLALDANILCQYLK